MGDPKDHDGMARTRGPAMPDTGAPRGPHGPGPDEAERRVAQHDWSRWRAGDRRAAPFEYPSWKS